MDKEEIGLQSVIDGKLRREMWDWDFLAGLDGVQTTLSGPS